MKHIIRSTMLPLLLVLASAVYGGVPTMHVTVFDDRGAVAFKGATDANATFATEKLRPGHYLVQFDSTSAALRGNQYLLVISAGKKKVIADAVAGEKIAADGVIMKVVVGPRLNITGQVATEQAVSLKGEPNVRVINGKRYYWVAAETGSNLGGHWAEETLGGARNVIRFDAAYLRHLEDHAGEGSLLDAKGGSMGYTVDH